MIEVVELKNAGSVLQTDEGSVKFENFISFHDITYEVSNSGLLCKRKSKKRILDSVRYVCN